MLDYKIRELKAQIDPKNDKIAEMKKEMGISSENSEVKPSFNAWL